MPQEITHNFGSQQQPGTQMIAPPRDAPPIMPREGPVKETAAGTYVAPVFSDDIKKMMAAHGIEMVQPEVASRAPNVLRDGLPLYVVMHTIVGRNIQSQTGTHEQLGLTEQRAQQLVASGALRHVKVYEEEYIDEKGRLPGARYVGACAPRAGIDEAIVAMEIKQEEIRKAKAAEEAEKLAAKREAEDTRRLIRMLAERGLDGFKQDQQN